MTIHALHSKASIKGHPIHPMLVGFPIALYTSGLAFLIAYAAVRDPFFYRAAMMLWLGGVGMALLAAVFGTVDLFLGVPRSETATRKTGYKHFAINLFATVLFVAGAISLLGNWYRDFDGAQLPVGLPIVIGIVGLALTAVAGVLGWKLVQTHHVGIEEPSEHLTDEDDQSVRWRPPHVTTRDDALPDHPRV